MTWTRCSRTPPRPTGALWRDQAVEVQISSQKDAISGVVLPVTHRWDVPLGIVRGCSSESFAWSVAQSIIDAARRGKDRHVYQLGDHDPSGIDAWRAFRSTVCGFLLEEHRAVYERIAAACPDDFGEDRYPREHEFGSESQCVFSAGEQIATAVFERLAVTESQIHRLNLPTRPTKQSDTRARGFEGGSVEVDAIPPTVLRQIAEEAITQHIDEHQLEITQV